MQDTLGKKQSILIVGAQHGDEKLGPLVWQHLNKHRPDLLTSVDYICGNPKAVSKNIRYIESDLNRSYSPSKSSNLSYEEKRAQEILGFIRSRDYRYILDMHTSTSDVDRMFVTVRLDGSVEQIINASSIKRIALMPQELGTQSLIGQIPQAISIEVNKDVACTALLIQEMVDLLDSLAQNSQQPKQDCEIYHVRDTIPLELNLGDSAQNFQISSKGFYPVLLKEKSYTTHQGFAAYKKDLATI